jgi:hypothetical protein
MERKEKVSKGGRVAVVGFIGSTTSLASREYISNIRLSLFLPAWSSPQSCKSSENLLCSVFHTRAGNMEAGV